MSKNKRYIKGQVGGLHGGYRGVTFRAISSLSELQKSVLSLLLHPTEIWTVASIAKHRGTTRQAVYNVIDKLKAKGLLFGSSMGGFSSGGVTLRPYPTSKGVTLHSIVTKPEVIRCHGHQWLLNIISKISSYRTTTPLCTPYRGHKVRFNNNSVEVYCRDRWEGITANTEEEARVHAWAYWLAYFKQLQYDKGIVLVKADHANIELVKCHYAHLHNGIAYDYKQEDKKLRCIGEDGKEWLIADFSHSINELDFTHSSLAQEDSEKLRRHLDVMRHPEVPTLADLSKFTLSIGDSLRSQVEVTTTILKLITPKQAEEPKDADPKAEKPFYIG